MKDQQWIRIGNWQSWFKEETKTKHFRSSHPEVFLRKGILKIRSKFLKEQPSLRAISINLQSNFIKITPVNLLHIFGTPLLKNTSGRLRLTFELYWYRNFTFRNAVDNRCWYASPPSFSYYIISRCHIKRDEWCKSCLIKTLTDLFCLRIFT